MTISTWPKNERPREKLLALGADALSDAELLAIFLRTGVPGKTAVDLARDLLIEFGSLRALLAASPTEFCSHRGLGKAKYVLLQASMEMSRRHLHEVITRENAITSFQETYQYLTTQLRDYGHEVFACLFLDSKHRLISFDELFHGTVNYANVYPREVVKRALRHNATSVILAHNHPSGIAEPSVADKQITLRLKSALELVDIRVLDHIVIGEGQYTSFAEMGYL